MEIKATEDNKEDSKMERIMERSIELAEENNRLLKKLQRQATIAFWFRLVWFGILIGLPFIAYFYILEPILDGLGPDYENLKNFLETYKIPGICKQ